MGQGVLSYETGRLVLWSREIGPVGQGELSSCGAGRLVLWVGAGRVVNCGLGQGELSSCGAGSVFLWDMETGAVEQGELSCVVGQGEW